MRAQQLAGRRPRDVLEVVRASAGLQAQDARAARLAVRSRSTGLTAAAVDDACTAERSVLRTWAMRGTLHMVATEDAGWLVGLLGPVFAAAGRPRRLALGLDDDTCERGVRAIGDVLADSGPLPRAKLVRRVTGRGVRIETVGQAPAHLVMLAALRGEICRGPEAAGGEATYVRLADWAGRRPALEPDAALAELARRYLVAYGPAGVADLAAWSGLGARRARQALELIAPELHEVSVGGRPAWMLTGVTARGGAGPVVRLLGAFDTYLLGYANRALALDPALDRRVRAGGGMIAPTLIVDGRVVATWRHRRAAGALAIAVEPFGALDDEVLAGLRREVRDLGRFLGTATALV